MKRLVLAMSALGLMSACGIGRKDAASDVTAISIGLPDRADLKTQVPDIDAKMNAYRLVVTPVDATCAGATTIDEIGDYVTSAKVGGSLKQGCDYNLTLSLGHKNVTPDPTTSPSPPTTPGIAVTYEGQVKGLITTNCATCHIVGFQNGDFTTYAGVKAKSSEIVDAATVRKTMPKAALLSASDQAILTAWAKGGYLEKATIATTPDPTSSPATTPLVESLVATYYKNDTAKHIGKDEIQGKAEVKAAMTLDLQADGKAIGLGVP